MSGIAIVGMACRYPDARSPEELWENVLAQRRAFRRLPDERLRLDDYYSPDPAAADRTYSPMAAVIEGYEFDRVRFRVVGSTYRSADLAHWLALDIAAAALADAGCAEGEGLPRETTGVVLGNTLTGEFSRANLMRLRWPYVRRVVEAALAAEGWEAEKRREFLRGLETSYKTPFPPVGEETLAGGLSNTIAGRICNQFDFKGGGYTVDGACCSSLLAVITACSALAAGDMDVALAGGVDLSLDPFELVGFAKTSALAPEKMRVYDVRSAGFWPGEGCGFVVLMREEDAIARKRRIYATVRGWGVSSDGSGGITRPAEEGQLLAVRRAYRRAGFGIETVVYFEGHGTGTEVGDATELRTVSRAIREALGQLPAGSRSVLSGAACGTEELREGTERSPCGGDLAGQSRGEPSMASHATPLNPMSDLASHATPLNADGGPCHTSDGVVPVIGSIKANIGHTKAAAGMAGLLKAVMATNHQVLPPTTGCERPHPELNGPSPVLRVLERGEAWPADRPLRTAVSAMGFGGINTHVVLEGQAATRAGTLAPRARGMLASAQDAEVFFLEGDDAAELRDLVDRLAKIAPRISMAEMGDLAAAALRTKAPPGQGRGLEDQGRGLQGGTRAAVVASTPAELAARLSTLAAWLSEGRMQGVDTALGLFVGRADGEPRIGFLFPGQGSPAHLTGGALRRRFDFVDAWYEKAALPSGVDGVATEVAQPAIVTASAAALEVLERLGITACVAVGHSLGEFTALYWGGAYDREALLRIARARGRAMADLGSPTGGMASLRAGREEVERLVDGASVIIAGLNSPRQTVISGEAAAVAAVITRAKEAGIRAVRLPVSHAFHSPLVAAAAPALGQHLATETFQRLSRTVCSTITGMRLEPDGDLGALLCRQVTSPVRFIEAVQAAAQRTDLLIEVGPGEVISGLAAECVDQPVVATDAGGPSLAGLLKAVAAAFVMGAPVRREALFAGRHVKPFDLDYRPKFFVNPCERAPVMEGAERTEETAAEAISRGDHPPAKARGSLPEHAAAKAGGSPAKVGGSAALMPGATPLEVVRHLVAERTELPVSAVRDENRLLSDLHLNSITVGQLVAESARRLGLPPPVAPTDYADATVAAVAQALEELRELGGGATAADDKRAPPGVDAWIRAFTIELIERPVPHRQPPTLTTGWKVFAPPDYPLSEAIAGAFARGGTGGGVILCLPPKPDERHVPLMLEAARAAMAAEADAKTCAETPPSGAAPPIGPKFVVVQHGGGGAGLARTLHLERPKITTCVVDVPADHPQAAEWVLAEALAAMDYREAHYDAGGRRRVPRLRVLSHQPSAVSRQPEPVSREPSTVSERSATAIEALLSPQDVLLVTGGGKGIAAECALALARECGVKLALMGRSNPSGDADLAANLERLGKAGAVFKYISADVTDAEQVRAAVRQIEAAFGPVTAFLHGAGSNVPQLLTALDEAAFLDALRPKLQGARNVLAAVHPERLTLVVAFGSIIARMGLPGEAHYAVANDWLAELLDQWQRDHPHCRCLTLEWSVWAGVGMGQRLGRIDALAGQGVTPIPVDEGIRWMRELLAESAPMPTSGAGALTGSSPTRASAPPRPTRVVVTGRFGEPPTLKMEERELPLLRFVEHALAHYPGVELLLDIELSAEADPYLNDHVFSGAKLLPAVMGLEAMAQAAMTLVGTEKPPTFENVWFNRPVVVPDGSEETIRLAALARSAGCVDVVLRSKQTAFQVDHFSATCLFEEKLSAISRQPSAGSGENTETPSRREPPALAGGYVRGGELPGSGHPATKAAGSPLGDNAADAGGAQDSPHAPLHSPSLARRAGTENDFAFRIPQSVLPIDPERDLYGGILFHRGRFRRLRGYRRLTATECIAEIGPGGGEEWFGRYLPMTLVLGDPGARDAAVHAIQPCIPHARILPVGVDRVWPLLAETAGPRFAVAQERSRDGDLFVYDLDIVRADGVVCERWEGLRLQVVEGTGPPKEWVEALLGPYIERRVNELVLGQGRDRNAATNKNRDRKGAEDRSRDRKGAEGAGADVHVYVEGAEEGAPSDRRERSDRAIGRLLGTSELVLRRPDGKPEAAAEGRTISTAHAGDVTMAVGASGPVGCDVEAVTPRSAQAWHDLLGGQGYALAETIAREAAEAFESAATRVWAAGECLKKAGAAPDTPSVFASAPGDGWVMLRSGRLTALTYVASVRGEGRPLVFAVVCQR